MRGALHPACLWASLLACVLAGFAGAAPDPDEAAVPADLAPDLAAARAHVAAYRIEDALTALDRAIAAAAERKLTAAEAFLLTEAAGSAWVRERPLRALDYHTRSLPLWRQLGNREREAYALFISAMVLRNQREVDRAMEYQRASLAIYEALDRPVMVAENLLNIGLLCTSCGEYDAGKAAYEQAIAAARRAAARGLEAHSQEAHALRMISEIVYVFGRYGESLTYIQRAREVSRTAGHRAGEAAALLRSAPPHLALGAGREALEAMREAEALAVRAERPDMQAEARIATARVLVKLNRDEEAYATFRAARELVRAARKLWVEADMLVDLAHLARRRGAVAEAFGYLDDAEAIGVQLGEVTTVRRVEATRGEFLLAEGRLSEAEQLFRGAAAINHPWPRANALRGLGRVQRAQGNLEAARASHREAQTLLEKIGNQWSIARELALLADVERDAGLPAEAARLLEQAVSLIETVREGVGIAPEARAGYLWNNLHLYHRLVATYQDLEQPVAAFKWAERARARALLDLMDLGKVAIRAGMTEEERAEEARLSREAAAAGRELERAGRGAEDAAELGDLKRRAEAAQSRLRLFIGRLYRNHPHLAAQRQAKTVEAADLAEFLPRDTVLIEYVVLEPRDATSNGDGVLALCGTAEGRPVAWKVSASAADLRRKVEAFRKACASGDLRYREPARELYELLIPARFRREMAGKKRLLVCPDGFLWGLPFQALVRPGQPTGREAHLIEEYEVAYQYSASTAMLSLRREGSPVPARPISGKGVAIFARGSFGSELPALPHAAAEAEAVRRAFPGAALYQNQEAEEGKAKEVAGRFRYLHFATHGRLNDVAPLESNLALARREGEGEDGALSAREVFDLDLDAELVVLSACRSGDGEKATGEGLIGFAWALSAAGARAQVLSQWDLSDASTARFMAALYGSLAAGRPKSEALRAAVRDLQAVERYRHPRYWAPFILLGDWR